jgi:hypothetical protein
MLTITLPMCYLDKENSQYYFQPLVSYLLTMNVPYEGYSRKASCPLNYIFTFFTILVLFHFASHFIYFLVMLIMKMCCSYLIICRRIIIFQRQGSRVHKLPVYHIDTLWTRDRCTAKM